MLVHEETQRHSRQNSPLVWLDGEDQCRHENDTRNLEVSRHFYLATIFALAFANKTLISCRWFNWPSFEEIWGNSYQVSLSSYSKGRRSERHLHKGAQLVCFLREAMHLLLDLECWGVRHCARLLLDLITQCQQRSVPAT